jgi:hypothetical protein
LDIRAQTAQSLIHALETPVNLGNVLDHRFALGAKGCDQHRHAGPNIGAG